MRGASAGLIEHLGQEHRFVPSLTRDAAHAHSARVVHERYCAFTERLRT